jgi:hypothetical protein
VFRLGRAEPVRCESKDCRWAGEDPNFSSMANVHHAPGCRVILPRNNVGMHRVMDLPAGKETCRNPHCGATPWLCKNKLRWIDCGRIRLPLSELTSFDYHNELSFHYPTSKIHTIEESDGIPAVLRQRHAKLQGERGEQEKEFTASKNHAIPPDSFSHLILGRELPCPKGR